MLRRTLIVLLPLSALALAACSNSWSRVGHGSNHRGRPRMSLVPVTHARLPQTIIVGGTLLAAQEQGILSFKVAGRVEQILVNLGSRVGAGQAVARLAETDFSLRVGQADAALQQSRAGLGLNVPARTISSIPSRRQSCAKRVPCSTKRS